MKFLFRRFEALIDPFRSYNEGTPPDSLWRFYWRFIVQAWPVFIVLILAGFFATLTEVMVFRYIAEVIDILTTAKPADLWTRHGPDFVRMLLVLGLAWPLTIMFHSLILRQAVESNFSSLIRWQSHRHVVRQSLSFFSNDYAGRVASKVIDTAGALRNTLTSLFDTFLYLVVYVVSALYLFIEADLRLIGPLAIWGALYAGGCWWFIPRLAEASKAGSEARSSLVGRTVDSYTNIQTVKLFANTQFEDDYVREGLRINNSAWQVQQRLISSLEAYVAVINAALLIGMGGLAIWLWGISAITVGAIAMIAALTNRLLNMSGWIMFQITGLFENIGTVQNGMETIARPHSVTDAPDARDLTVSDGEVRFDDVRFHYGAGEGGPVALDGIDLTLKPGEKIGVVGPSGAGKSTLVNVFLRLYDLSSGRITIDGQDIAQVGQESLRARIGMVTQDNSLLHRSIRDNIAYGRPDATEAEIIEAAERAHAWSFIPGLNDGKGGEGLDAQVGERGVKLSGGQRQRIAIARVLLKDAPILVLDEATSALDSEVEAAIQESLLDLMQGKTVIAIAHRLSTIARMDRLVVMDKGRIIETGTHAELLAQGGLYARLWARQTGGFIAD
ncbi:ABC transporter ATP-binding protein [Asticcacaulis sp. YBE204]|uniref:ABC transporter ATP-binding protein n=1 Tax=Asticcacaulis sp. YBE204 TaxID=1282363 RepID=UPI0003C3BF1F|nr:ABC transporter ATP-binding protein [Asticcacaulis sp. YBE204]ESQ80166.1 hypothetical protein AEYBE204_05985 [Asticcacaulis sp. YBE204]